MNSAERRPGAPLVITGLRRHSSYPFTWRDSWRALSPYDWLMTILSIIVCIGMVALLIWCITITDSRRPHPPDPYPFFSQSPVYPVVDSPGDINPVAALTVVLSRECVTKRDAFAAKFAAYVRCTLLNWRRVCTGCVEEFREALLTLASIEQLHTPVDCHRQLLAVDDVQVIAAAGQQLRQLHQLNRCRLCVSEGAVLPAVSAAFDQYTAFVRCVNESTSPSSVVVEVSEDPHGAHGVCERCGSAMALLRRQAVQWSHTSICSDVEHMLKSASDLWGAAGCGEKGDVREPVILYSVLAVVCLVALISTFVYGIMARCRAALCAPQLSDPLITNDSSTEVQQ